MPDLTSTAEPVPHDITTRSGATLHYTDQGHGHPVLLLHGGGGPFSVAGLATHLASTRPVRAIVPTMPGFDGTVRPEACRNIDEVAARYLELLDALDLHEVTVVGSSAGGWTAAAMAVARAGRTDDLITSIVLINAVGITAPGHPITNVSGLRIDQLADLSYADPDRFRINPATLPPARLARMAANAAVFADYASDPYMHDPALAANLAAVTLPTLVLWGEADGIVDLAYGRAYAAAIRNAQFVPITGAGHLPYFEQPDMVRDLIWDFADQHATRKPD